MATKKVAEPRVRTRLVPEQVAKALARGKGSGIDAGGLLASLIECWGGRSRFAADIFAEYQAAKPGGMTRQRILEMISRLTVQVTTQEIARPRGAADMDDKELVVAASALLERLADGSTATAP